MSSFMEFSSEMQKAGRVTIPVELRKKYNIQEGDIVIFAEADDHLKIVTRKQALQNARALLKGVEISSEDFLGWRREEAQREQQELQNWDEEAQT
jgi:AbrB family looped-hinge helix DNA binding protein